jgi:cytochrome c peroxidase
MRALTAVGLALLAAASAAQAVHFTEAEVRAILAHGPWPVPIAKDPTNRVSGERQAIELGERLFFDPRLSASAKFSCGTCHVPERNWTDNQTRGAAVAEVDRNTPTLMNVRLGRWFGWSGAADSIWSQSIRPMLDPRELGATPRHIADLVRKDEQFACRYRKTFGTAPSATDDEAVMVDVAKALAAFQETFETPPTPFDAFRDALMRGEVKPWTYSDAGKRGLRIFIGKGMCSTCHSGPNFSNGEFRDNGFSSGEPGRAEGVKILSASRFNRGGPFNDDPERRRPAVNDKEAGFKVPTLRHLMLTPPYGHHGRFERLADVVRHYSEVGSATLRPLQLTAAEQSDLVVFLESLSTFNNPWRPEDHGRCR